MAHRMMVLREYLELEGKNDARRRTTTSTAFTTGIIMSCVRTEADPEDQDLSLTDYDSRESTTIMMNEEETKKKREASRFSKAASLHPEHAENFFQFQHKLNIEINSKRIQQEIDAKISAKNEKKELISLQAMCLDQLKWRFVKCSQEMKVIMENIKTVQSAEELKTLDEHAKLHENCGKTCFDLIVKETNFMNTLKEEVDTHTQEIKTLKEELKELKEEVC